jgi:hypothetical protein
VTDETDGALNGEPHPARRPDPELVTPETAAAPEEDEFEGATPPGYNWPTHGGYLGCLMGVMAGVLLGGFLGANLLSFIYIDKNLPLAVFILLNVILFLLLLIGLGRLGWWLGRRYYRYYPQPVGPTWGESDNDEEAAEEPKVLSDANAAEISASEISAPEISAPEISAHEAPNAFEATEQRPA